ncbi:LIC_11321 family protein [Leptospira sarikeiensis]|uniref:Uncharacterized protein n=1 Tax=Leptospira sarikeiensis TaxID=2484943 RepID=A0A4R9KFN9_9LEPT|nr:hypothetical protein [Leptospira sarikeiensis]TGL64093.1 hypothetical protein EHQ64_03630 [Leptospira sarikeiensis]
MRSFQVQILLFLIVIICASISVFGVSPEPKKDPKTSEPSPKKEKPSNSKGCCKIKYEGGGFDYFPATEEECVAKSGYQSFEKDSVLCFQSLWD